MQRAAARAAVDPTSTQKIPTADAVAPAAPNDTTALIKSLIEKSPSTVDDAPTIITMARQKAGPDAQHAESLVGRRLGHFELLESVGIGGMAAVIKAHDVDLGRTVALKILPPDMAADPENISRFKQEARAAARLDHENIARVYFCGEDQGLHFIAFEFVEGENLRVSLEKRGGVLPVAESLHYLIQVTTGLSHAASRGVVHRDIKPSNIIITPEGKAKIVDMGLARNLDPKAADGQLTQSGVTLGTFDYISPEQAIEPRSADCRSDIYSLGCTFYHVMTGQLPVPEGTAAKKLHCHQHVAPLDPRELNPAIPDEMASVLGKMMAKDPAQRYQHPDHLLQHLLAVAQKLNLPTGSVVTDSNSHAGAYNDRPLPPPPSLSPLWIGVAVVVLVLGLFAITGIPGSGGGKNSLDSAPFWQKDRPISQPASGPNPPKEISPGPTTETPVLSKGPRQPRNAAELVALLKQPAAHIRLEPGAVFDLVLASKKDPNLPQAIFEGNELILESTAANAPNPPTIRLAAAERDDGKSSRPGSLTIRGRSIGSPARVRFHGIRFEFVADDPAPEAAAVSLLDVDKVEIEECVFATLQKGPLRDGPAAIVIAQQQAKETSPEVRFDRCYFAPGSVAVQIVRGAGQLVRAKQCAFGPQFAAFRVEGGSRDLESGEPVRIRLESCSMLLNTGSIVEVGDQVPCKVEAGWCLFSNPELGDKEQSQAFLIRQHGSIAPDTSFAGCKIADTMLPMPNGYQNIQAYGCNGLSYNFDDCKTEMLPIEDAAARILKESPWNEVKPITRLLDLPGRFQHVFAIDLKQEILRLEPDKNRNLLGTANVSGTKIYYTFPYPPIDQSKLAANVKVLYPEFPGDDKDLPAGMFRSMKKAIPFLEKGDVLLIRHNGDLEVDPSEFGRADTDITIKPDENFHPVLVPFGPNQILPKKEPALFKLYGGQLLLQNLHFKLKVDRAPAIVWMPGGGQCTFRNCIVTLEEGDDLTVVSLADPRGEMMMMGMTSPERWPAPKIAIENTYVRGRGRVAYVHGSRPFDLRVKNSLLVLDGSLISVDPAQADLSEATPSQVNLENITTYLTKHLLHQKATEKRSEGKGFGLVPIEIHATQCLFAAAAEQTPLVQLDRIETLGQAESVFQWKDCRQNLYGFKPEQALLVLHSDGADSARPERLDRDRWFARWKETESWFGEVVFNKRQESKRFDGAKMKDFQVQSVMPPFKEGVTDVGVSIEVLGKLAPEE